MNYGVILSSFPLGENGFVVSQLPFGHSRLRDRVDFVEGASAVLHGIERLVNRERILYIMMLLQYLSFRPLFVHKMVPSKVAT